MRATGAVDSLNRWAAGALVVAVVGLAACNHVTPSRGGQVTNLASSAPPSPRATAPPRGLGPPLGLEPPPPRAGAIDSVVVTGSRVTGSRPPWGRGGGLRTPPRESDGGPRRPQSSSAASRPDRAKAPRPAAPAAPPSAPQNTYQIVWGGAETLQYLRDNTITVGVASKDFAGAKAQVAQGGKFMGQDAAILAATASAHLSGPPDQVQISGDDQDRSKAVTSYANVYWTWYVKPTANVPATTLTLTLKSPLRTAAGAAPVEQTVFFRAFAVRISPFYQFILALQTLKTLEAAVTGVISVGGIAAIWRWARRRRRSPARGTAESGVR